MQDKIHSINGTDITVKTQQTSTHPLAFKIRAEHPAGAFHETSLTVGDVELQNITSLEEAQTHLDRAREKTAIMCSKKAALSALASQLN